MRPLWTIVKQHYARLVERYSALSLRERILYSAVSVGVVLLVIDQSMIQRIANERDITQRRIELTRTAIDNAKVSIDQLDRMRLSDEDRVLNDQLDQLRQQMKEIERQMQATVQSFVPPDAVVAVLEELLGTDDDLRLVRLQSHAPRPVTSGSATEEIQNAAAGAAAPMSDLGEDGKGLYRHGLTLEIEGSYGATTSYLRRIESSPWHLLWERFDYRVEEYPRARIRIDLHTISDQEEWIGV